MYRHAIMYVKKELECERQEEDTIQNIRTRLLLAFSYDVAGYKDSAALVYDQLDKSIHNIDDSITQAIYFSQKANYLLGIGRNEEADSTFALSPSVKDRSSDLSISLISNKIDGIRHNMDSVKKRSEELLKSSDIYVRRHALGRLSRISLEEGNIEKAISYTEHFIGVADSITVRETNNSVAEIEEMLGYSELENTNAILEADIQKRRYIVILLSIGIILISTITIAIYYRNKLQKAYLSHRLDQISRDSLKLKNDTDKEIGRLKNEVNSLESNLKKNAKEHAIYSRISLSEISSFFLTESMNPKCTIEQDRFSQLEASLMDSFPDLMAFLNQMHLSQRSYRDAMLILIDIPLKSCANILGTTDSALANSRRRNFDKIPDNDKFRNWADFIKNFYMVSK